MEVSEYFKNLGATSACISHQRDGRKQVTICFPHKKQKCMSYARYIWISTYGEIPDGYEVDHINNDKTDDRLENYQLLSIVDNRRKENALKPPKEMVECICPVCGKEFQIEKRNFKFKNNPCCSRKCGGIKSHWK